MSQNLDEVLQRPNEFLSSLSDKVTPNTILFATLINGFLLGVFNWLFLSILTPDQLGEYELAVKSIMYGLFAWQFAVIFVFSSKYTPSTSDYLGRLIFTGFTGFYFQQQVFGMYAESFDPKMLKIIQPVVADGFGVFILFVFLYGLKKCFSENKAELKPSDQFKLKDGQ